MTHPLGIRLQVPGRTDQLYSPTTYVRVRTWERVAVLWHRGYRFADTPATWAERPWPGEEPPR